MIWIPRIIARLLDWWWKQRQEHVTEDWVLARRRYDGD